MLIIAANYYGILSNVFLPDNNLIKRDQNYVLSKLDSKELYKIFFLNIILKNIFLN